MTRALTAAKEAELADLRDRCSVMLAAFERAEPDPKHFADLRAIVERVAGSRSLPGLRSVLREFRGMAAGLSVGAQRELARDLAARFGPDSLAARDAATVARIQARGRISSEREYRIVCAHADALAGDPDAQAEFLALGALLDAYMVAPSHLTNR